MKKVQAIEKAPTPSNVSQLHSFIGLVNYYCKFLPNLANTLAPLYSLLQKDKKWLWGSDQKAKFYKAKCQRTSESCWSTMTRVRSYCYHVMPLPMT